MCSEQAPGDLDGQNVNAKLNDLHRRLSRVEELLAMRQDLGQSAARIPVAGPADEAARGTCADSPDVGRDEGGEGAADAGAATPITPVSTAEVVRALRERRDELRAAADAEAVSSAQTSDAAEVETPATPGAPVAVGETPAGVESKQRSLEMLIGLNWMAWAGAASVVLAVGFFVKLAYDQGWFGMLTPAGKCALSAAFGGALLVCGEIARRRVGRVAAASLFGAGIATLYLTAFATFRWFHLVSEAGAFWLLLGVALLGFAITVHARLITTGVLATLGGYLAPVLLANASSFAGALHLYLTMLLGVTLCLSAWRERPLRVLRYVALCCHAIVGWLWALNRGGEEWAVGIVFLGVWWLLVNGEALLAALRGQSPRGNAIVSLFTAAWVMSMGHWLLSSAPEPCRDWIGVFAVTLAGLAALPAALFGPGISVLTHLPKRAVEKLTYAFWAQTGVLLAAAIGFQFDDFGQTIGWLALGYACVEVGRRLPSRAVDTFGLFVGVLSLVRVGSVDIHSPVLGGVFWQFGDVRITYWGLLALGAVATVFASALRLQVHGQPPRVRLPIVLAGVGTLGWTVVCLAQTRDLAQTGALLAAACVLVASYHVGRRLRCYTYGKILLWLCVVKWFLADSVAPRLSSLWQPTASVPVLNTTFGVALAITAGLAAAAWVCHRQAQALHDAGKRMSPARWQRLICCAGVFLLVALSFEVSHVIGHHAVSFGKSIWRTEVLHVLWLALLWATGGVALFLAAWRWRWTSVANAACVITLGAVVLWLSAGTTMPRAAFGVVPATVLLNVQFMVGVLISVLIAVVLRLAYTRRATTLLPEASVASIVTTCGAALIAIGLWLGSLELDRFFAPESGRVADAATARQTALSIYWGVYAIGLVALGFARRMPWTRYVGLGLLTVALGKVVLVDMSEAASAYRVLSFLGVGLLLIVTSLAYAKVSRHLAMDEPGPGTT